MNYLIKNILVPTDFSESADNALRLAIAMAKRHKATIHLVNIVPLYTLPPNLEIIRDSERELPASIAAAQEQLENFRDGIEDRQEVNILCKAEFGSVAEEIAVYVRSRQIDLVVMGTHGISGWKELFIGSTTMAAIQECPCPLLAVPSTYKGSDFQSILYPVRVVDGAPEKYNYIRSIAKKNQSAIHLLGLYKDNENENTQMIDQMKKVIEVILDEQDMISYQTDICHEIAEEVIATAHQRLDDLIVINATFDTEWKDLFTGSYTQQIINQSHIPVLALKI